METPEIFSPSGDGDGSPHTGTFRSKSVLSRVANAELAAGTENGLNERYVCGVCGARVRCRTNWAEWCNRTCAER